MNGLEVNRSLYYYHKGEEENLSISKRGRPVPGYSLTVSGKMISDEQIKEFLMEAFEGEEGVYGYQKLTNYLRVVHFLVINKKKSAAFM